MDLDKIAAKVVEAGGGISDSSLYGKLKRALLSSIRDIERNFINVKLNYSNREVNGTVDGHTVQFFFSILRASNGEVFGLPVLTVDGKKRDRFYGKISDELAKALKETGGKAASVKVAKELVKLARELVGAAGPLTLLEELKGNIHKLDDDKFLEMTSHGWGHTPGVDYIYGTAGNDIAHAIVGYSVGNVTKERLIATVKKNIGQAIEDNQAFKGLSGEQQETRKLWFKLMKQGKK